MVIKRYKPLTPRRPKYNNVATSIHVNGETRTYHSRFEAGYALQLHQMVRDGKLAKVEEQVVYRIEVNGKKICRHIVDFQITLPDGRQKLVEAKGKRTDVYIIKRRLVEALYDIPYLENPSEIEMLR